MRRVRSVCSSRAGGWDVRLVGLWQMQLPDAQKISSRHGSCRYSSDTGNLLVIQMLETDLHWPRVCFILTGDLTVLFT
jgi:hypothetical protein